MSPRNLFGAAGNPYYAPMVGGAAGAAKTGIDFGTILSNTQKTLNLVNSAIPLIYQVGPLFKNAGTMLRVYNEMKKDDSQPRAETQTQRRQSGSAFGNGFASSRNTNNENRSNNTTNNPRLFI